MGGGITEERGAFRQYGLDRCKSLPRIFLARSGVIHDSVEYVHGIAGQLIPILREIAASGGHRLMRLLPW